MDALTHPAFGTLHWNVEFSNWEAQVRWRGDEWIEVSIAPNGIDASVALDQAAILFARLVAEEPRILRNAVEKELLEIHNDCWRNDDEQVLTANELIAQLQLDLLTIDLPTDGKYPVELWYAPRTEYMFGGHCPALVLDSRLQVWMVDLRG